MAATSVVNTIKRLLPVKASELPPVLRPGSGNLYQVLSRTPSGGIGTEIHQTRWSSKNIVDSYWVVTRSQFKCEGRHGKAWGRLYWKGKLVSPRDEPIRGSLKYSWQEGRSRALGPKIPSTPQEGQTRLSSN